MVLGILNYMHIGLVLHSVLDILHSYVGAIKLKAAIVCMILNLKFGLCNRLAADIIEDTVLDRDGVIIATVDDKLSNIGIERSACKTCNGNAGVINVGRTE